MAAIQIVNNTSNKTLVAGQFSAQPIDPRSLPLFAGDTLTIDLYLLETPAGYNSRDPQNSQLATVPTAGLTPFLALNDGTLNGTVYAQVVDFAADASGEFWSGHLALTGVTLAGLMASASGASVYLKIGYFQNGLPTTTFSAQLTVLPGIPVGAPVAVPGLTALSAEVANQTYVPQQPAAGMPILMMSASGKKFALQIVDNPDGTASFQANPIA